MPIFTNSKKVTIQSIILLVFCFFLVFLFKLPNNIYISNIIYYILLIVQSRNLNFRRNKATKYYIIFIIMVFVSTVKSILEGDFITERNIIQLIFSIQYYILILDIGIESEKFMKKIYLFGLLEAIYVVCSFLIISGVPDSFINLFTVNKKWGYGLVPGYPNGIVPLLLIVLLLSMKYKRKMIETIIIVGALIVSTSRAALVGILLVFCYWILKGITKKQVYLLLMIIFISVIFLSLAMLFFHDTQSTNSQLNKIIFRTYDRVFLFRLSLVYFSQKPFLGYGGNTLDQIIQESNYILPVAHTHNTILEMIIRYGLFGTIPFLLLLLSIYKKIEDNDMKFLFLLLLFLSLFQVFIRDFNFLFYLYVISIEKQHCYVGRGQNE